MPPKKVAVNSTKIHRLFPVTFILPLLFKDRFHPNMLLYFVSKVKFLKFFFSVLEINTPSFGAFLSKESGIVANNKLYPSHLCLIAKLALLGKRAYYNLKQLTAAYSNVPRNFSLLN